MSPAHRENNMLRIILHPHFLTLVATSCILPPLLSGGNVARGLNDHFVSPTFNMANKVSTTVMVSL